jgi:alpha-L-fucosidase
LKGQLKELLTNYGPIGVLWFDGEWIKEWDERQGAELEKYLRGLQPDLIVNNRVGKRKKSPGDFGTPEQTIPATGMPGMDWETCMTLNETWGYRKDDHHWKSSTDVLHKLVDIVSKGGNFLLNVGPTAEGIIPEPSVERLLEAGKWLEANGESIYGTTASPFRKLPWGRATQKPGKLYLHVFEWPKDGKLVVPGLTGDPRRAYLLREPKADLKWTRAGENVELQVSATAPDKDVTVVVLAVEGPVQVVGLTTVQPQGQPLVLKAAMAECHGAAIQYEAKGDNIGFWTNPADYVAWVCRITTPGVYSVELDYACSEAAAGSDFVVEIAGQKLEGKASATGGWTTYRTLKLGNLTLGDDRHTLAVKALNRQGEGVMNVRAVRLTPR